MKAIYWIAISIFAAANFWLFEIYELGSSNLAFFSAPELIPGMVFSVVVLVVVVAGIVWLLDFIFGHNNSRPLADRDQ